MSDRTEQQPLVLPHDVEALAETEPRDVPQAATSILCRFGWHKWSQWSGLRREYHRSTFKNLVHQTRECIHCKRLQGREVYW